VYARSATIDADPQRIDDGIRLVRDELMPAVRRLDGCAGLSMLCDRESGRCIVISSWRSETAMRASIDTMRDMVRRSAKALGGGVTRVDEWEIALMHRPFMADDGSWARVVRLRCDPASLPEALEDLPLTLLPLIDATEGFCSLSLFVDRTSGDGWIKGVYENRRTLEASRDSGEGLRDKMAEHLGMEITEVAEFELAIPALRVPYRS
jgi:quinol monooxygenase YgiN